MESIFEDKNNEEDENLSFNFICPICNQEVKEEDGDNATFDGENLQFYHISCLNKQKENNKIEFEDSARLGDFLPKK